MQCSKQSHVLQCVGELPEVEVGESLQVAEAGGQGPHPIVVQAQCLQGDELTQLLWQLTQAVL